MDASPPGRCTHCVAARPFYSRIAERFDGRVEFGVINCEANQMCKPGNRFHIGSYPTIMMLSTR
jgi:thioredoxin-like negative regulator of GroEL